MSEPNTQLEKFAEAGEAQAGGNAGMMILARIAAWRRGSDREEGYRGLNSSEKFQALTNRGWALDEAREIMAEVEAELAEREPHSKS